MISVMITGCSKHSKELIDILRENYDGENIKVVGIDCDENHILTTGVDAHYIVPRVTEESYIPTVLDICKKEGVDIILPFITIELELMARNAEMFAEHGIKVSVSSLESLLTANNKIEMHKRYSELMPRQMNVTKAMQIDMFAKYIGYPQKNFCCKLADKFGGIGFVIVDEVKGKDISIINKYCTNRYVTLEMLKMLVTNYNGEIILQEYIEGYDYSVCVLADKGEVLYMQGFVGYEMSYGAVVSGKIEDNDRAYEIARKVCSNLKLDGNACLDFMIGRNGEVKLLEVNPRLSASLPFLAKAGLNLPYLRCAQLLERKLPHMIGVNKDLRMRKYYESEYYI